MACTQKLGLMVPHVNEQRLPADTEELGLMVPQVDEQRLPADTGVRLIVVDRWSKGAQPFRPCGAHPGTGAHGATCQ
eukprot:1158454-Pelagomonas_calceolata.AAC.14